MKSIYIFILFVIVAIAQILVPANMILDKEHIISNGKVYKFKTRPIDPTDAFRGKYIALDFEADVFQTRDSLWKRGEDIYVYLKTDSLGYVQIQDVSKEVLEYADVEFIMAQAGMYNNYNNKLFIKYPFDRFYMEEYKAYEAELAVQENQRDSLLDDVYALVYVKNGEAVLKDVSINDMPIKDYVAMRLNEK